VPPLLIRQLGKECGLDRLSLFRREDRQGISQEAALLPEVEGLVRATGTSRRKWAGRMVVDRVFSACSNRSRSIALDRA